MYNSLNRIQNAFGFFTTVGFVVAALIAATDLLATRSPSGIIKPDNIQVYVFNRSHLVGIFFLNLLPESRVALITTLHAKKNMPSCDSPWKPISLPSLLGTPSSSLSM